MNKAALLVVVLLCGGILNIPHHPQSAGVSASAFINHLVSIHDGTGSASYTIHTEGGRDEYNLKKAVNSKERQLVSHDPIYIDGNNNFTIENGVIEGNGTKDNPYVIGGWAIEAKHKSGIKIRNTSAYFIITNCYIHGGRNNSKNGIWLYNITNGTVNNVTSKNNYRGLAISFSSNITVTSCYFYNGGGIGIGFSSNSTITNCVSHHNNHGLSLCGSNNQITYCKFFNNSEGIHGMCASNNIIANCEMYNNSMAGIYFLGSKFNEISNSTIYNNSLYGIHLNISSHSNRITRCLV